MKLIIAGSRHLTLNSWEIDDFLKKANLYGRITQVVSGVSPTGIDKSGEIWASDRGIDVLEFPANQAKYGRSAGPKRNQAMAKYADALLLCWDGHSPGSLNMFKEARLQEIPVHDFRFMFGEYWKYLGTM